MTRAAFPAQHIFTHLSDKKGAIDYGNQNSHSHKRTGSAHETGRHSGSRDEEIPRLHHYSENPGKDRKGKEITIKLACYREVDYFINLLRNRPDRRGTVVESIDFTDYKALPMDPVNRFEHEQTDYSKYDELVGALHLSALELAILNCYMNGMVQSEVCAELSIGRGKINSRKASIRQRYYNLYGAY